MGRKMNGKMSSMDIFGISNIPQNVQKKVIKPKQTKKKEYKKTETRFDNRDDTPSQLFGFNKKTVKGLEKLESAKVKDKSIGYKLYLKGVKFKDKYIKRCKEDEEEYYPYPKTIEKKPSSGEYSTLDLSRPLDYSMFGFIFPINREYEDGIMVKGNREKRCFRKEKPILPNSVEDDGKCYKDEQCKEGTCSGSFYGIVEGKCKLPRQKKNVEEGNPCASTNECRDGLKCEGNWGGLKLGACVKDKSYKLTYDDKLKLAIQRRKRDAFARNNTRRRADLAVKKSRKRMNIDRMYRQRQRGFR